MSPKSRQEKEMNSIVKKYVDSCSHGEKLNIKRYLREVCSTNKSFFYPDDTQTETENVSKAEHYDTKESKLMLGKSYD